LSTRPNPGASSHTTCTHIHRAMDVIGIFKSLTNGALRFMRNVCPSSGSEESSSRLRGEEEHVVEAQGSEVCSEFFCLFVKAFFYRDPRGW
jgi:hypothetical protein